MGKKSMKDDTSKLLLLDQHNRQHTYLRLSITDVCNFHCGYCLPHGYKKASQDFLTIEEIKHLLKAFAVLGLQKIRITGGEPTVRKDFLSIVEMLQQFPDIRVRALSTNGFQLQKMAKNLFSAGLNAINISIDSLDPNKFFALTKQNRLSEVLAGINTAVDVGFKHVKVNAVLLKDTNDNELADFLVWLKAMPITVRFIELMQTGTNRDFFDKFHISSQFIREKLINEGWQKINKDSLAGPAEEYQHADYAGRVGIIAPYSNNFCNSCNRLRISAQGQLFLCLFGNLGYSIRDLLQSDTQTLELTNKICSLLQLKESSHKLATLDTGANQHFAAIGG